MLAAGKDGVDDNRFESAEHWVRNTHDSGFRHLPYQKHRKPLSKNNQNSQKH
jgi:hypothetical protein